VQAFSNPSVLVGGIAELGEDRRIALFREHVMSPFVKGRLAGCVIHTVLDLMIVPMSFDNHRKSEPIFRLLQSCSFWNLVL
jgi:hypothetical protein